MIDSKIKSKLDKLEALEMGGVDNWDGYERCLEAWRKKSHVNNCIDIAIDNINNLMVDAEIHDNFN